MAHTYTNLLTHFIFSTKDRFPILEPELKSRLFPYMGGDHPGIGGDGARYQRPNGPRSHSRFDASQTGSRRNHRKSESQFHWLDSQEFAQRSSFSWQVGYAAFSVSHSQEQAVLDYIANQEEHHRKLSFKEELVAFLKKHEIDYDDRYLWD